MSEFAAVLNLADIDGTNGFRLDGDAVQDYSGVAAGGGGDVNGDGFADILIGAPVSNTGGADRGLAWVVFGAAAAPAAEGLAAKVAAGQAYRFQGEAAVDRAGFSIANAGDVNGDGFDDLIIGATSADPDAAAGNRGASYLVFGGAALEAFDLADGTNDNQVELANLTAATGYRFDGGADFDQSGTDVSGAGDVNGDGIADLLIGAPNADPNGGSNEGASYIVFGGSANLADLDDDDGIADGRIDLVNIGVGQGLRLDGETLFVNNKSGQSVALVGDVNGDGFDDVLVGAPYADPKGADNSEGAAYLVFGRDQSLFTAASLNLASLNGLEGTRFDGVAAGDTAGVSVSGLGDVNGDGFADIVIGASRADPSGSNSGSAYVVFGKSGFGASNDLSALDGSNGFRLDGLRADDQSGLAVSAAGDVNGDGLADVLISAYRFDRLGAINVGAVYVAFGKVSGFNAVIDLGGLDGDDGFRIEGVAATDNLGFGQMRAAGDVNGDGFDDIVVGAYNADNNSLNNSGSTYIIYGHRADTSVTRIGTGLDNTINGGKGADSISGLDGADTLVGWEGDDTISGGSGNDALDGGDGDDTMSGLDGDDTLDGGTGNDDLSGGSGRDVFFVSDGEDHLAGGSDKDQFNFTGLGSTAVTIDLSNGEFAHPNGEDTQTFVSIEDVVGTGGADTISGTSGKNVLNGAGGGDTIGGGDGNDVITGGANGDQLTGGLGSDRFDYNAVAESKGGTATTRDTIIDFTVDPALTSAFIDRLDLSTIDAQAGTGGNQTFSFIAQAAFSAEGQIRAIQSGADTIVQVNTTGTTTAEMTILLQNFTATDLDGVDFIL